MAKIYNVPDAIEVPKFNWENIPQYEKDCDKFKEDLKKYLNSINYNEEVTGEIIQFPVGDGYAQYMVASLKPAMLIHLPIGDEWSFQYANLLTAKEIKEKINQRKALEKLFADNKKRQTEGKK